MTGPSRLNYKRGRVSSALPFLFCLFLGLAGGLRAARNLVELKTPENAHLDLGVLSLLLGADKLSEAPAAAMWPTFSSGIVVLPSAGASWATSGLHWSIVAATGQAEASQASRSSRVLIDLGLVSIEERYTHDHWEAGAGLIVGAGRAAVELRDVAVPSLSRLETWAPAYGVVTHIRWPREARLSFGASAGYLWWSPSGAWLGASNAAGNVTRLSLDAPFAQASIQLSL